MLHHDGGTYLNDTPVPDSTAILPDSLVQTLKGHSARIDVEGSAIEIAPETVTQFAGNLLVLTHGSLQLDTSRGMAVVVGCVTVRPVTSSRTRYDVTDLDGKVKVSVYADDVTIHYQHTPRGAKKGAASDVTVHQGEQTTRDEKCGAAARPAQIVPAKGPLLNSRYAVDAGIVAIALTCLKICRSGDDPISPAKP
jgi:hypothetical protein